MTTQEPTRWILNPSVTVMTERFQNGERCACGNCKVFVCKGQPWCKGAGGASCPWCYVILHGDIRTGEMIQRDMDILNNQ